MNYYGYILLAYSVTFFYFFKASQPSPAKIFKARTALINAQAKKLFSYRPGIAIQEESRAPVHKVCIFLHGWCGHRAQLKLKVLKGQASLISFNFPDASPKRFFWRSSLGQLNEVMIAAYVVHQAYKAGFRSIGLFGVSRGGAVVLNLLRFLADPAYEQHRLSLAMSNQDAQEIITAIQSSSLVLQVPLTDSNRAIALQLDQVKGMVKKYTRYQSSLRSIDYFASKIQQWSKHNHQGMQACQSAQWLVEHGYAFKSLWYIAHNDRVVCNRAIQETYEHFHTFNPEHTLCITGHGGHNSPVCQEFLDTIHF